jgi:hypothetical protein
MGETLPNGERIGRFGLNAVAAVGLNGRLTFATTTREEAERSAIYCHCSTTAPLRDQ